MRHCFEKLVARRAEGVVARAAACAIVALAVSLAVAPAQAQAQLYKWVDEKGVTHWSDRPVGGADRVEMPAAQGYQPAVSQPRPAERSAAADPSTEAVAYDRVEIVRPGNDETLANTGGAVELVAALSPALAPGHRTWFVLDGQRLQDLPPAATSATVEAFRGSHTVSFEVEDATGTIVASAPPITFHVRQTSIARPPVGPAVRPAQPRPRP
jgi:hypothetical protein